MYGLKNIGDQFVTPPPASLRCVSTAACSKRQCKINHLKMASSLLLNSQRVGRTRNCAV
jgi:hypothetical protein